ncbi:mitochondrial carrier domain-containing protein [Syncephalis plumigaleata]|nr:mitochondrial carrier domain-containing protein [Syncephalis plumigaleata]
MSLYRMVQVSSPAENTPSLHDRLRGFAAGVASGVSKLVIGHPFDTLKVRLQTEGGAGRFTGLTDCLMSTIRKEGVFALYKGATPPLIGWMFMDAIMLGSLSNYRLLLQKGDKTRPLSIKQHAIAGCATRVYTGPIDCARKLIHNNGVFGLWKGLGLTMAFRSFFGAFWGSYELYSIQLRRRGYDKNVVSFIAGGLAANTYWTLAFPVDVVKNRWMTQPDVKPQRYPNVMTCIRDVYQVGKGTTRFL